MFDSGYIFDDRFQVDGLCNASGGMGTLLFVHDLKREYPQKLVLKYCNFEDDMYIRRFKREVRLLHSFADNPLVVKTIYSNTDSTIPFFIMEYHEKGDLTNQYEKLQINYNLQEQTFISMIRCIQVLHEKGIYHRDIKPSNFLLGSQDNIIVTDFGLGVELDSSTRQTKTAVSGGTRGYMPPEFHDGDFKYADARGDIYMLGKSFYELLTGKDPTYITTEGIHPAVFNVIEKACNLNKDRRFQSLKELDESLIVAYDVVLNRNIDFFTDILIKVQKVHNGSGTVSDIVSILKELPLLKDGDQEKICLNLELSFFENIIHPETNEYIDKFLEIYSNMVENASYTFSFAEVITNNMKIIFQSDVEERIRAEALLIAIRSAHLMSRFNAMDTCQDMITSSMTNELGLFVSATILKSKADFLESIEASSCKNSHVVSAINAIKQES